MAIETTLFVLLMVASAVALLAKRLQLPYTVTLVVAGLGLGALSPRASWLDLDRVRLTPELLFNVFLPVLLFEAAFHLSWPKFKENLRAILLLAVPGVIGAIALGGAFAFWLEPLAATPLPLIVSFLLASMLAATDPVSVVAVFKELRVPRRMAVIVEGESLLNDAIGVVAFIVVSTLLGFGAHGGEPVTALWVARFLLWEVAVSLAVGVGVGLFVSWATTLVDDHLIEIMLTTIAAFGSYLVATMLHASPVLAVVAAGMACGNVGARYGMTPTNRIAVESFWEYAVFVANGFVFLLLGKEIDLARMLGHALPILIAWFALVASRAIVTTAVVRLLARTRERLPPRWIAVLSWGGLRGSLSMVLALSLPASFAERELLIDLTFGVVLLSILVQGPTMKYVLRWAGAIGDAGEHVEYIRIRTALRALRQAFRHLDTQRASGAVDELTYASIRMRLGGREAHLEQQLAGFDGIAANANEAERTRIERELLDVERRVVQQAGDTGVLPQEAVVALLDDLAARELATRSESRVDGLPEESGRSSDEEAAAATAPSESAGPVKHDE